MQRHKIIARTILLIISVINFVLAAPLLERGIREVRVDVADVVKDVPVTAASWKRWNPSDKWWTDSALAYKRDLRPHDARSPMDPNASPQPSLPVGSTGPDNSHPLSVDPPTPEHDLQFDMDLNDHGAPQPGREVPNSPNSGSHLTGSPTPSDFYYSTEYPWSSDQEEAQSPSPSQSHDFNPPLHENLDLPFNSIFINPSTTAWSAPPGPGPWRNPPVNSRLAMSDSDQSTGTYSSEQSTGASSPEQSTGAPSPEQLTGTHPPEQSTEAHSPQDPSIHPPPSSEAEDVLSDLFRGSRFKRRISGFRSMNAAQKELQDVLDSSDSTIQSPDKILDAPATTAIP